MGAYCVFFLLLTNPILTALPTNTPAAIAEAVAPFVVASCRGHEHGRGQWWWQWQ